MLKKLKGINPALVKRLQSRLFFVVNKADVMYNCEGLQEEETKQYVADLVTSQLQHDGFQLSPEQVCHHHLDVFSDVGSADELISFSV